MSRRRPRPHAVVRRPLEGFSSPAGPEPAPAPPPEPAPVPPEPEAPAAAPAEIAAPQPPAAAIAISPTEPRVEILTGHVIDVLRGLPAGIVQTVVTSPPYWNLRDYARCECVRPRAVMRPDFDALKVQGLATWTDRDVTPASPTLDPDPACPKCGGTGRDRSLEVVWDGDPACAHEWGAEITNPGKSGGKDNPYAEKLRIKGAENYQAFGATTSALCVRCGAWRGQLGLEIDPQDYVRHIVQVFREVRRVMRDDGTLWLNLGDCYAGTGSGQSDTGKASYGPEAWPQDRAVPPGIKPKDMVGIPWMVAFALRADGWWLRSDPIWSKLNPMPESVDGWRWERHMKEEVVRGEDGRVKRVRVKERVVERRIDVGGDLVETERKGGDVPCPGCDACRDHGGYVLRRDSWRPTKSHEYVFLLAKSDSYFADAESVREPISESTIARARFRYPNPIDTPDYDSKHDPGDFRRFPIMGQMMAQRPTPKHAVADPDNRAKPGFGHDTGWSGNDQYEYLARGRNLRTVWSIPTEPYPEAHFATFPRKLVEPCVRAGSSAAGCCATCGAPWAPVVERKVGDPRPTDADQEYGIASGGHSRSRPPSAFFAQATSTERRTSGFRPTCDHGGDPVPCTVMDPFGGSGTVGQVARELRRSAILVEIKEEYVRLAQERVNQGQLTLGDFPENEAR